MMVQPPVRAIWSNRWMVLGVALVAALVAAGASTFQRPTYAAVATLRSPTLTTTGGGGPHPDIKYSDRVANTYASLATTTPVLNDVRERLRLAARPALDAWVPANSELIRVRAQALGAADAARVANAGAEALARRVAMIATDSAGASASTLSAVLAASAALRFARGEEARTRREPVRHARALAVLVSRRARFRELQSEFDLASLSASQPYMLQPATVPSTAQFPSPAQMPLLGGLLGLLAGAGLAIRRGHAGRTVRSAQDINDRIRPVLATVPWFRGSIGGALGRPARREQSLRHLSANVLTLGKRTRVVAVSSPEGSAGTTTIVANLGAALASPGLRVLVADANLRFPHLHRVMNMDGAVGLSDVLAGEMPVRRAVQASTVPNLEVLATGTPRQDTLQALADERLGALLKNLKRRSARVISDVPAVPEFTDAEQLGARVGGMVLVLRSGRTKISALRAAGDNLALLGVPLLGVIMLGVIINAQRRGSKPLSHCTLCRPRGERQ